ncbi:hypothetical protein [Amycolatopsis sp. cmx-4-68]|uniref:MmyB family transcriptional regulator n=1 Tax=Amycolatopsis sp. cmx-4-68 TaxID=2790938 RepID=UPI00397B0AB9
MTSYRIHTVDTARPAAKEPLAVLRDAFGFMPAVVEAIRRGERPADPRMAALSAFTRDLIRSAATSARRFFAFLQSGQPKGAPEPANVLRRMFHPDGVRRHVTNWPEVAEALVRRARREAIGGAADERAQRILDEVLGYPGVPSSLRSLTAAAPVLPVVPIRYARDGRRFGYFSTVTTLGTPQDVTLQELRIECFFPMDDETRRRAHDLAEPSRRRSREPDQAGSP